VLIDSTHRRWIIATIIVAILACGLFAFLSARSPDGLTGGSLVGLWYGILGSALMVFAGLLAFLKRVPTWTWLGMRKSWLRGHIWLGLLSVVFVVCHSGPGLGGPLEIALWIVLGLVIASGIFGLVLQQIVPRMLLDRVPAEAPYEQIPHYCNLMRAQADVLADDLCGAMLEDRLGSPPAFGEPTELSRRQVREFYEAEVRPFLAARPSGKSALADPLRAEAAFEMLRGLPGFASAREALNKLQKLCDERRALAAEERYHLLLHSWLVVHVPLSAGLLVLAAWHAVASLYF
jgi:hypothetical protein